MILQAGVNKKGSFGKFGVPKKIDDDNLWINPSGIRMGIDCIHITDACDSVNTTGREINLLKINSPFILILLQIY
jgi:hypothetical protein